MAPSATSKREATDISACGTRCPSARRSWCARGLLAMVILAAVLLRALYTTHTEFEVDELQHIHAAYLVARGQTPYVDFFEHHTPLFYFLGSWFLDPETSGPDSIFTLRRASFSAHVAVLALGTAMATLVSPEVAIATIALLLTEIFSFAWGTLAFLDSFAAPVLLLSAFLLASSRRGPLLYLRVGLLIGVAILLTQKAVFAAPAAVSFLVLEAISKPGQRLKYFAANAGWLGLGGLVLPFAVLLVLLGFDGFAAFWDATVGLNAQWLARRPPVGELFLAMSYDGSIWLLAGIGLIPALRRGSVDSGSARAALVPALYLTWLLVGTGLLPVVWYEYFIQIGPFAAIVAAITAIDLARIAGLLEGEPIYLPPRAWLLPVALGFLGAALLVSIGLRLTVDHYSPTMSPTELGLLLAGLGVLSAGYLRARRKERGPRAALLLLLLFCLVPLLGQASWLERPSNLRQQRRIAYLNESVGPEERVFDGYSGYGLFRPHAYRYWFLHDEMLLMLSESERTDDIIAALAHPRVRAAIRDVYTKELPAPVQRYLDENFEPGLPPIWIRRTTPEKP